MRRCKAFTLIELLIVVAIIGILAAIAVPNFLNAHIRSKVTQTLAQMKNLYTSIEMYNMDNTRRLLAVGRECYPDYVKLTTPVAYMSSKDLAKDIFYKDGISNENFPGRNLGCLSFRDWKQKPYILEPVIYFLPKYRFSISVGPDCIISEVPLEWGVSPRYINRFPYSITNGVNSAGDIVWSDRSETEYRHIF